MPRNFEIRRQDKPGLPLAVGEQRDDGTCTAIFAGTGYELASIDDVLAACEGVSSTGIEVVYADEAP